MAHELDLNWIHFPTFPQLPPGGDAPLRGWVLLAEAVQDISMFRPVYRCKDAAGNFLTVAVYYDNNIVRRLPPLVRRVPVLTPALQPMPKIRIGDTLCLENATTHYFIDGQVGVRLEDPSRLVVRAFAVLGLLHSESLTILSCSAHDQTLRSSIAKVRNLNDQLVKSGPESACQACQKEGARKRCIKCATPYCSQVRPPSICPEFNYTLLISLPSRNVKVPVRAFVGFARSHFS
jgi:hypothetical protein